MNTKMLNNKEKGAFEKVKVENYNASDSGVTALVPTASQPQINLV